jgi:hypothetical protein
MRPRAFVQLGSIPLQPALDRGVNHLQSPFEHQFLEVAIAQRIAKVPAHTPQNDLSCEMTPFERGGIAQEGNSSAVLELRLSVAEHPPFCNTACQATSEDECVFQGLQQTRLLLLPIGEVTDDVPLLLPEADTVRIRE